MDFALRSSYLNSRMYHLAVNHKVFNPFATDG